MTFNEYLNLEIDNLETINEYYLEYLTNLSSKDFPYEQQLQLKGAAGKFINSIEKVSYLGNEKKEKYFNSIEKFEHELRNYRRIKNSSKLASLIFPYRKNRIFHIQDQFGEIYSESLNFINEATKMKDYSSERLNLNGFYKPENSNKRKIVNLINEAIDLIVNDNSLTEKSKKQIINYLNKVLKNLESEHTNWPKIIGKIKETIIVLGALGSVAGGISPLLQAKEKLEETTTVIQQTSVNLNYKVINETFNIQQIEGVNSTILQIQENNQTLIEEKN